MTRRSLQPGLSVRRASELASLRGAEVDARRDEILDALGDGDWRVRHEASLALARTETREPVIAALLDRVVGGAIEARNAALASLGLQGAAATEAIVRRLAAERGPARRFLVEALREANPSAAVDPLCALLDDADVNVSVAAMETLALARGPAVDAALVQGLEHRDPVVRLASLLALERRPEVVDVERVARLIDDAVCARAAVRALAVATDPAAAELLVARLEDPRRTVVGEALRGLVEGAWRRPTAGRESAERTSLPPHIARGTLKRLARLASPEESAQTRAAALAMLGRVGDPTTRAVVLAGCEDQDHAVASAAHAALDGFSLDAAALGEAAATGDRALRAVLSTLRARGLGHDAARVSEALEALITSRRLAPRAMEVLAACGGPAQRARALELLRDIIARDGEESGWLPAIEALVAVSDVARASLAAWARGNAVGVAAAAALAPWGVRVSDDALRAGLAHVDPRVRRLALRALAARGGDDLGAVRAALDDDDDGVRAEAADAWCARALRGDDLLALARDGAVPAAVRRRAVELMAFRAPSSAEDLRALLGDADVEVARAALGTLSSSVRALELEALVAQRDPTLAAEALAALRDLDPARADGLSLTLLDHPSWALRWEAARGLDGRDPRARAALLDRLDHETDPAVREVIAARLGVEVLAG